MTRAVPAPAPAPEPPPPPEPPIATAVRARADDGDEREALRRALTDLEAAKGRLERDARRAEQATRTRLVAELIPVLDDLDRSLAAGSADKAMLEGVELTRQHLERVMQGYGLERIATKDERFDPAVHEAVAVAPVTDPALDGLVTDELARGYRIGQRVERPARVRVGKLAS